jgi:cell division protein FtsZ
MTAPHAIPVTILALGGGGSKIVRALAQGSTARWAQLACMDTDVRDLEFAEGVLQVPMGRQWTHDQGCGDDPVQGQRAAEASREELRQVLAGSELLILVTCLGGGAGSGGAPVVARLAKEIGLVCFAVVCLPLAGEGNGPRALAEDALTQLRPQCDVLVPIPADLLFSQLPHDTPSSQAFALANQLFADGILGLAELMRCRGDIPIDFASLKHVLRHRDAQCALGVGRAPADQPPAAVIDDLLRSPLLGGPDFIAGADVVVATLVAAPDLPFSQVTQCLTQLNERLNPATRTFLGANLVPERAGQLQLTMLVISYCKALPQPAPARKGGKAKSKGREQQEITRQFKLPFAEDAGALGIFVNSSPTLYHGENLDIPTYQRRGVVLEPDQP